MSTARTSRSRLHAVLAAPPSRTECTETPYSTKNPHTITLVQVVKQVSRKEIKHNGNLINTVKGSLRTDFKNTRKGLNKSQNLWGFILIFITHFYLYNCKANIKVLFSLKITSKKQTVL